MCLLIKNQKRIITQQWIVATTCNTGIRTMALSSTKTVSIIEIITDILIKATTPTPTITRNNGLVPLRSQVLKRA